MRTAPWRGRGLPAPGQRWLAWLLVVLSVAAQLVVLVPFTIAAGLLAPLWAVVLLHVLWAGYAVLLWWTVRRRPLVSPLVPLGSAATWFAVMSLGEAVFGWTA